MQINPKNFIKINVTDTCAIWNLLSSLSLYKTAISVDCHFCITGFVNYECLIKKRSENTKEDQELQQRLKIELTKKNIKICSLEIEDLHEVELLKHRKNLGKGELSSIALAKKINQAIMTDDQKARRLAEQTIEAIQVQTTPHLFGWLIYKGFLADHQKEEIINEHKHLNRPLTEYFNEMYIRALECRLIK